PPFPFRTGFVPPRDILARTPFKKFDPDATHDARKAAENSVRFVYTQDQSGVVQLKSNLKNRLADISKAQTLADLPTDLWQEFSPPSAPNVESPPKDEQEAEFQQFHQAV